MMKSKKWIFPVIILAILVAALLYFYFNNNDSSNHISDTSESDYEASKTGTNTSVNTTENANQTPEQNSSNNESQANSTNSTNTESSKPKEEQLATFSTKIYSKDSARQNNINITCSTLNGTIVKNGATFSFCGTVGQATSDKGYQKADIFDRNGNKKKGLGGGNCQISSTLYNAVLAVPSLVVTERHEHSNYVPYVPKGKDAAVAYGSYDFKFRNDSGNDIKITASTDGKNVTTTITALK